MKHSLSTLTLALALPALCAATAAAQFSVVRFTAPISPIAGLPKLLPSPMTGPLAGTGISLPALTPSLIPTPALQFLSAPQAALPAQTPFSLPVRGSQLPAMPAQPSRDGVVNPLRRVMPGVMIRFSAAQASAQPSSASPDASKEKLDETFDGGSAPAKPAVRLPRRDREEPVASGRRITLPEWDLEKDLGL